MPLFLMWPVGKADPNSMASGHMDRWTLRLRNSIFGGILEVSATQTQRLREAPGGFFGGV